MNLLYKLEKRNDVFFVEIREKGSKRRLYLDTLRSLAKQIDEPALALLVKLQLSTHRNVQTVTFEKIQIPNQFVKEVIRLLEKTDRFENTIESKQKQVLSVTPKLVLKDAWGSFADLWMSYGEEEIEFDDFSPTVLGRTRLRVEEKGFEKDLLEVGFIRKTVETSKYFCPKEQVKDALTLLIEIGWDVRDRNDQPIQLSLEIVEEEGSIAIRAASRSLIDHQLQMEGVWQGEVLYVKKSRIGAVVSLLKNDQVKWDPQLIHLVEALKNGETITQAAVSQKFCGKLLSYQQKGVDWLNFLYRWGFSGLLADEMGLGKTIQVLAFLSQLRTNLPVLIVAPASLIFNWRREIDRFYPELHYQIVSYTSLRLNIETFSKVRFEVVVLDESNAIKQATTQTARAVCRLLANFRICLSGTPMENRLDELWSQFHFLMPGLLERGHAPECVRRRIRPFILRRKKTEVELDLPEKIEQLSWVEMTHEQKELYDSYKKRVQKEDGSKVHVLEAILKLRQICVDPRLVGSDIRGAKLDQLVKEVEEIRAEKHKILIFSQFTSMLKLVHQDIHDAICLDGSMSLKQREERIIQFQEDPNCEVFLLSLKAGGVGLTLTSADYVYLLDPWWNDAVENQAIDRAHRIGQKKTVIAKKLITVNTIEEKILELKSKKLKAADQLLEVEENLTQEELLSLLA